MLFIQESWKQWSSCKGIQDSLGFLLIPCREFRIPGNRLDSLSCIPYSKAQDSEFHEKIFPDSRLHK